MVFIGGNRGVLYWSGMGGLDRRVTGELFIGGTTGHFVVMTVGASPM